MREVRLNRLGSEKRGCHARLDIHERAFEDVAIGNATLLVLADSGGRVVEDDFCNRWSSDNGSYRNA